MAVQLSIGDGADARKIRIDTPEPPEGLPYAEVEDFRARELLRVNGIALTPEALVLTLADDEEALQSAAAHTLGSLGSRAAIPALAKLASASDDVAKVEAAYALARLGADDGREILRQCLTYPVGAYLSPSMAAGYLAQLDDPEGFSVVVRCLEVDNVIVRVVACKQLFFFAPFHGALTSDGDPIDVFVQFERALGDPYRDVQWATLVQLRELRAQESRRILEDYARGPADEYQREVAQGILNGL